MMMFRLWQNALLDKVQRQHFGVGAGWKGGDLYIYVYICRSIIPVTEVYA